MLSNVPVLYIFISFSSYVLENDGKTYPILNRLTIRVLITYKTDRKWFGNSSLAIVCTLNTLYTFWAPRKLKDTKMRYSQKLENQLCLLFGHSYRLKRGLKYI